MARNQLSLTNSLGDPGLNAAAEVDEDEDEDEDVVVDADSDANSDVTSRGVELLVEEQA